MLSKRLPKFRAVELRELTRDDLPRLLEPRARTTVAKLRDSHHRVARLFAMGLRKSEVVARSGYSLSRIDVLYPDPSFQELIAKYRAMVDESFVASADEYHDLVTRNMIAAERHVADHIEELDETGELLPVRTALAISRDAADRMGYGKKQTNVNVNVDFAKNLEGMLRRSGKTIEGVVSRPLPPRPMPAQVIDAPVTLPELAPIRRRA